MELRIEYICTDELKPYKKNARKHKETDIKNIAKSIEKYGMNDAIGIWGKQKTIVEGHGRWLACKELGIEKVPCIRLDHLSDKERREYAIAHNATAELSEWDFDILAEELPELDLGEFDFDLEFDFEDTSEQEEESEEEKAFREKMARGEISEDSEEYKEFLEKFELKKTTDDCYTPDNIYKAVKDWCIEKYSLQGKRIIRPFYPGGDYQSEDYSGNCVVIDNPPFSIISEICKWYSEQNIKYFMFAPRLTLLGINRGKEHYVVTNNGITYENGAVVNTAFVTNLGEKKIIASPDLHAIVEEQNDINLKAKRRNLPKYEYPDHVITSSMLGYMAQHGAALEIGEDDVYFIRALDSQKDTDKGLFGSGFLLSEKAAAEKAAAEKAAVEKWELSAREWEIIKSLGKAVKQNE